MSQKSQSDNVINRFKDEYEIYSNFYPCVIYFENRNYPTVEHAFVAAKTKDELFRYKIAQLKEDQAGLAKRMGRKIKLRNDWEAIKISLMFRFLCQKFNYERFYNPLMDTKGKMLIEGNYWHDNFWGDCYCKKCKSIVGKNMLGKLLMKVRDEIL